MNILKIEIRELSEFLLDYLDTVIFEDDNLYGKTIKDIDALVCILFHVLVDGANKHGIGRYNVITAKDTVRSILNVDMATVYGICNTLLRYISRIYESYTIDELIVDYYDDCFLTLSYE